MVAERDAAEWEALAVELLVIAEDALKAARRKSTKRDDAEVERLIAAGGAAVAALAAQLAAGSITRQQFLDRATAALRSHGVQAGSIGAAQFDGELDEAALDDLLDGQADYLDGFADDINGGGLSEAEIAARGALYGGLLWSVYQMGRGDGAEQAGIEQVWWDLDPGAQHCDDCPDLADDSPYAYPDELPTYPGQDVACGNNCRCALRFESDEKAAPVPLMKEARCPNCRHLEARNVNVGAGLNCRKCRKGFTVLTG